jgi:hypothetical protein
MIGFDNWWLDFDHKCEGPVVGKDGGGRPKSPLNGGWC